MTFLYILDLQQLLVGLKILLISVSHSQLNQNKQDKQMINLDAMPPDWKFAANHAHAVKPGRHDNIYTTNNSNIFCPCCLKPTVRTEVPLCSNSKQLEFLGFGFPLYFIFIKYCIILLLILICSHNAMSLYWAISQNYQLCSHRRLAGDGGPLCTSFMIRFSRIQTQVTDAELILRIACFVIHLFTLIYIRDNINKTIEYYDEKTTSLSDYTLVMKNLPLKSGIQTSIKNFIHNHFKQTWDQMKKTYQGKQFKQDKKVMQIILLPDLTQFYKLQADKHELIEQKRALYTLNQSPDKSEVSLINKQILDVRTQMEIVSKDFRDRALKDQLHSEIAIVTLNSQLFKQHVLEYGQENTLNSQLVKEYFGQFEGKIQTKQAPEPNQIIWEYVNYPISKRFGRRLMGWGLTILFLAVTTVVFYFLLLAKTNNLLNALKQKEEGLGEESQKHMAIAVGLVYIALILIVLFNKLLMGWVLHQFTHIEKHDSTKSQQFSFALKYTLGLFFTTALMTLAVEAITFHNYYLHEYGVIEQETIMFFINAFFVPLIWLINPWQLFVLFKRRNTQGKKNVTQAEANKIMSDCHYTIGKRYAEIIETMWFTFLYATLIPFGAFLAILGIGVYYWVDKYNLLRRSSLRHNLSARMTVISLKLLDMTLILMPLGQLLFDKQIRDGVNAATIVFIVIAFLYLILPINKILQFVHKEEFKQEEKSYEDVKDMFLETYQTLHPLMSLKANTILQRMRSKASKDIAMSKLEVNDSIKDQIQDKDIDQAEIMEITLKFGQSQMELLPNLNDTEAELDKNKTQTKIKRTDSS